MREQPPAELVALFEEIGLASRSTLASVRGRVRRLARGLPAFSSVWVDALAQARALTPWQAAEINADRGARLAVGPYVLCRPLPSAQWTQSYLAHHRASGERVRLLIAACPAGEARERIARFERLLASSEHVTCRGVPLPLACGHEGDHVWCAAPLVEGIPAAGWCSRRGRMPPEVVLEIARQMTAALAELARFELVHGDVSTHTLHLAPDGRVALADALFRAVARPAEGFALLDAPPEAFDYLAPERAGDGRPADAASDLYACGLVWWHLLTGRPPLAGGDSLTKLQSACAPRITAAERIAPDVPAALTAAIRACLALDPAERPASFAELSAALGRSTTRGRCTLETLFQQSRPVHSSSSGARRPALLAAASAALFFACTLYFTPQMSWLGLRRDPPPAPKPTAAAPESRPAAPPEPAPVKPASFTADEGQITLDGNVVRLPAGRVSLARLKLKSGQVVAPPPGERTTCLVGPQGLAVEGAQVRFENVNFVHASSSASAERPALVVLHSAQAQFIGCTFDGSLDEHTLGAAIAWHSPAGAAGQTAATRLDMTDCVIRAVRHGIAVEHELGVATLWRNCLYLGPGPAVLLHAPPQFETPVVVACQQFTLRDAAGLIEVPAANGQAPTDGTLRVEFSQSVFAPPAGAELVTFAGAEPASHAAAAAITLRGDSSVVQPGVMLVAWRDARQTLHPLGDERYNVEGLVRGAVEFAAPARQGPGTSQLTRWQVPLIADEPPGINPKKGVRTIFPTHF